MEATVVGHVDVGDANRVVRFLNGPRGRFAVMVRGARSAKKGLGALLEAGVRVRLDLRRGRGPLPLLSEAHLVEMPRRARTDLLRLSMLAYGVELCAALAPEDHEAHKLDRLLTVWLELLEGDEEPGPAARQALEAKALTFAGLAPALVGCAVCGERLEPPTVWNPERGGGCHGRCAPGTAVDPGALLRLEALRRTPLADTPGVRPADAGGALGDFAEWHLGHGLKSRTLLSEVEGLG